MSEAIIKEYCRLVTTDCEGCLDLFDHLSVFTTRIGAEPVEMLGRDKIRPFIASQPGFLEVELVEYHQANQGVYEAVIRFVGLERPDDRVRFTVADGRFRHFELIPGKKTTGCDNT